MERYEFSETEKQLLRALSEGKTPEELEQLFDMDVLETHLNRLQELEMAVAHFSLGLLAAETESGQSYRRLIQSAIHIKMAVKASAIAMQLRMVFIINDFKYFHISCLFERRQKYGARFVMACRASRMGVYSPPAT